MSNPDAAPTPRGVNPAWIAGTDFVMIHMDLVDALGGSYAAAALLNRIMYRAGREGWWAASLDEIQADTRLTRAVVNRAVRELRAAGMIESERVHAYGSTLRWRVRFVGEPEAEPAGETEPAPAPNETSPGSGSPGIRNHDSRGSENETPGETESVPPASTNQAAQGSDIRPPSSYKNRKNTKKKTPAAAAAAEHGRTVLEGVVVDDEPAALIPAPAQAPAAAEPTAATLVAAWIDGWTEARPGQQPDRAVVNRVAGQCAQVAKTRTTTESWRDAWHAAKAAGRRGKVDVVAVLADYRPDHTARPSRMQENLAVTAQLAAEQAAQLDPWADRPAPMIGASQ